MPLARHQKRKPPNDGGNSVLIKIIMLVCFLRAIPGTN
uniref:Uncharacterized protein n=2 Tax=Enterobacteriaceae TaxID=543 RepID=A0A1B1LNP3_ECOLX|nr:hypothetical protein [Escherichia coli]ARX75703.1 hypothetical protein [Shigella flexneri Y]QZN13955.1 hypothetical protein [Klebsiella pneumoniae]ARK35992.1 hypothetical protein [Escherichia coli]ARX60847.1 hypothetical protein [Escherichia coli]